jgi:hypothetical protein
MDERDVVETARAIRPHLWRLVGGHYDAVDRELDDLLARAEAGQPVKHAILRVLSQHATTRELANRILQELMDHHTYEGLAQIPQTPPVLRYACPQCEFDWYRFDAADEVPSCPNHLVVLVPGSS